MNNNKRLVGEIKSLDKSVLIMKTSFSDSDFKIKWSQVKEIYSQSLFIVALNDGRRLDAKINANPENKKEVLIDGGVYVFKTALNNIILLESVGKSFWSRINASFDLGLVLTKANNSKQFTENALVSYTGKRWSISSFYNSVLSSQDDVEDIKRLEGDVSFIRFLPKDWFLSTSTNFLSNNEQNLKLRSTGKLGGGYYFKHTNSLYFGTGTGLAFNNEVFTDPALESRNSMEVYFGMVFNKYDIGDLSLFTSLTAYPSITEKGRFRTDLKFDLKYDFFKDFYVKSGITYNFDNQPAADAAKGDYIFQTSFGWELD
ncbi:MAG: DUF481 domain-containing protein [Flavobacteriaceae bacterium]|nr:DUF481 domain-containing protein [Flavobacteriaceae bacterium]